MSSIEHQDRCGNMEHKAYMERLQQLGLFSTMMKGYPILVYNCLTTGYKEDSGMLFSEVHSNKLVGIGKHVGAWEKMLGHFDKFPYFYH